jgi:hypothetical protein
MQVHQTLSTFYFCSWVPIFFFFSVKTACKFQAYISFKIQFSCNKFQESNKVYKQYSGGSSQQDVKFKQNTQ